MEKIPVFSDFIKNRIKSTNEYKSTGDDNLISDNAKQKLWEYMHACIESAIEYENDSIEDHTIEEYLKESVSLMSLLATKALNENKLLNKLSENVINENSKDDKESIEKVKEHVKKRLDNTCKIMKESFIKGIEKARLENNSIANMVAHKMIKN